ncbi:MAG: Gfo/Idh/MocA family oxidoreductase [Lachnospiraceae bacterium]|nr:Gfo/Idh/MocA family oxidoreductase [Lachnospiraceae bacterium]
MIRVATIGTNYITDWFATALLTSPLYEYAAVYSRKMETGKAFADKYGVKKVYDNLDELAEADDIDVIYIASPTAYHYAHAMMMMNNGKHVMVEKPIASNSEELSLMLQAAKDNNVIMMEMMRPAHAPGNKTIIDNLSKLGDIRIATLQYCQYSGRYDSYKKGIIENAFKPELSNGSIMDIGVYPIHTLAQVFGMPESIKTDVFHLSNGCDGAGAIMAHYPDKICQVLYSKVTDHKTPSQIQGEKGCMLIETIPFPKKITILYRDGSVEDVPVWEDEREVSGNNMIYEIEDFAKLMEEGKVDHDYLKASIVEMKIIDEARKQVGIIFPADKIREML